MGIDLLGLINGPVGLNVGFGGGLGGERVGYDAHLGLSLGAAGPRGALVVTVGGGSDDAALALRPAGYLYARGDLVLAFADAFNVVGTYRWLARARDGSEHHVLAGFGIGCADTRPGCLQFTARGSLARFPEVDVTGLGVILGVDIRIFPH